MVSLLILAIAFVVCIIAFAVSLTVVTGCLLWLLVLLLIIPIIILVIAAVKKSFNFKVKKGPFEVECRVKK